MNRPLFLTSPLSHTRTQRTTSDAAREAYAIERYAKRRWVQLETLTALGFVIGLVGLALWA